MPDENDRQSTPQHNEVGTNQEGHFVTQTVDPAPDMSTLAPNHAPELVRRHPSIALVLYIAVAMGVLLALFAAYTISGKYKKAASQTTPVSNVWTGKGNDYKWSNASNWSLGVPTSSQDVMIDAASPSFSNTPTVPSIEIDGHNVAVHRLIFGGTITKTVDFSISGQPLTVSGGIDDAVVHTNSSAESRIGIDADLVLSADQLLQVTSNVTSGEQQSQNHLSLRNLDIQDHTISFHLSRGGLDVFGATVGTGTYSLADNAVGPYSNLEFGTTSPKFAGSVVIGRGDMASVAEEIADSFDTSTINAFGSATITIKDGGALRLITPHGAPYVLTNNITMGGKGIAATDPNAGSFTGAIQTCNSNADGPCFAGGEVDATGAITLTSDTELGSQFYSPTGKLVGTTYVLSKLVKGSYTLTAVPGSNVVIK